VYDERNNQDRYNKNQYNKVKSRVYVVKKQDENKNINNEEAENFFEVKKHEFDYYVVKEFSYHAMNSNINFYDIKVYNQKDNKKLKVNFVTISMIQCCDCHQIFIVRNVLFCHLHSESFKITHCFNKKIKTTSSLTAMLTKSLSELSKIVLTSVVVKDIETDYNFQN